MGKPPCELSDISFLLWAKPLQMSPAWEFIRVIPAVVIGKSPYRSRQDEPTISNIHRSREPSNILMSIGAPTVACDNPLIEHEPFVFIDDAQIQPINRETIPNIETPIIWMLIVINVTRDKGKRVF